MRRFLIVCVAVAALSPMPLGAQRGAPPLPAPVGRAVAPIDVTGYWVALVTDDWRYRMLTPPKGNADFLPVTADAGGVMRLPGRLHITWENDTTLKMDLDAGTQTRRFQFGAAAAAAEPSWQGSSVARWQLPSGRGRGPATTGQLVVTTNRLRPGYLRKNGVPYSANAVITEYFVKLEDEGQEYLVVTIMVDDPQYLQLPYIKTYQYKKQPDATGWAPTPCVAR